MFVLQGRSELDGWLRILGYFLEFVLLGIIVIGENTPSVHSALTRMKRFGPMEPPDRQAGVHTTRMYGIFY